MSEMMPEAISHPTTARQNAQIEETKSIVETFGQFDQTAGPDGSHYAPAEANPFTEQGLVCSNCVFFEGPRACEVVAGDIDPNAVCKLWVIPADLVTASEQPQEESGMRLTFSAPITAANVDTRTITGQIVPWGKPGNTSAGPVVFELGSLAEFDPTSVKLLMQHDGTRPIGRGVSASITPGGINMTFKVSNTSAGTDALIEAQDGLRDGLSIGASIDKFTNKGGVMHVTAAKLIEVSAVTDPAFSDARITDVVASENPETPDSTTALEETTTTEETAVDNTTPAEDVTASAVQVQASNAPIYTEVRSPIKDSASYIEHSIRAAQGDDDSKMYVRAADDSTSTNTGLTLPNHLTEFITSTLGNRPAVDAVRRETLISNGMSFTIPRLTVAPTVAETAQGIAPSETGMESDYLTVTVKKYSGVNDVSFELIDRSSPEFYIELQRELANAYAKATDAAVIAALTASGTQAATTAATAAGLQSFVATESAATLKGTGQYAQNLIASTDQWAALMGYADSTGRPLYNAAAPANSPGNAGPGSIMGNVLGLNLYVDPNITVSGIIDESAFIVDPNSVSVYESGQTRLQVNLLETGQLRVNLYGYMAIAVKKPLGVRRYNLT